MVSVLPLAESYKLMCAHARALMTLLEVSFIMFPDFVENGLVLKARPM
jgi:hypothetical protein